MTAFAIKTVALICMIIDHLSAAMPDYFPFYFRIIGRVSFPIFAYLTAEGCRHTKNIKKYMLRLGLFAILSQIPFCLAFANTRYNVPSVSFIFGTNIFYTICLGVLCIYMFQEAMQAINKIYIFIAAVLIITAITAAQLTFADYGGAGVAVIFLLYILPEKRLRYTAIFLLIMYLYGRFMLDGILQGWGINEFFTQRNIGLLMGAMASMPFIMLYNGKRGTGAKWLFYIAYPGHLALLALFTH